MTTLVGHADLLRVAAVLRAAGSDVETGLAETACILGYERLPRNDAVSPDPMAFVAPAQVQHEHLPSAAEPERVPYWQPTSFTWHDASVAPPEVLPTGLDAASAAHEQEMLARRAPPQPAQLAPPSRVVPQLQRAVQTGLQGRSLDIAQLVRAWARGVAVRRLPRTQRRGWPALVLLLDRSFRLVPFWRDQSDVCAWLRGLVGRVTVVVRFIDAAGPDGLAFDERGKPAPLLDGTLGGLPLIALTDLGWYGGPSLARAWLRLGRRLRRAGEQIFALVPVPPSRWTPDLVDVWKPLAWERPVSEPPRTPADLAARADRLLDLAAATRRLEPGLLRALRLLLPCSNADVGTEADAWMHADLDGMAADATVLRSDRARARRSRFAKEASALRTRVIAALHAWHWHRGRCPEVWHVEALLLAIGGRDIVGDAATRAEEFMARLVCTDEAVPPARAEALRRWLDATSVHVPALFDRTTAAGRSLQRTWAATHPPEDAPPDADPRLLASPDETPPAPRPYEVRHIGYGLELRPVGGETQSPSRGSRVGLLWASAPFVYPIGSTVSRTRVSLAQPARIPYDPTAPLELRTDHASLTLHIARMPTWAAHISDCGRDSHGLWFAVHHGAINFVLRWIPPGYRRILQDPGNDSYGRQTCAAVLERGFWLGASLVSQSLWAAVMGTNPSRIVHPDRPVDCVTPLQAEQFAGRLDELLPGEDDGSFRLPTEVEWEHARHAEQLLPNVPPIPIPLPTAVPGVQSGPTAPNPWGLHDMPGNAWEWCSGDPDDPSVPAHRRFYVARGSTRRTLDVRYADGDIGFRIARDQAPLDANPDPQEVP